MSKLDEIRDSKGNLPSFAWPGGYPLFYLDRKDNVLCPKCSNEAKDPDWPDDHPVAYAVNWEDPSLFCDACSDRIESAYADDESDESEE